MKTLTKKEAIELLGISPKTMQRRMALGLYKFTKTGEGQYAKVTFTYADLGLPEPEPVEPAPELAPVIETAPAPEPEPAPQPKPVVPERPMSNVELRAIEDQIFAEQYKQGLVTDSSGNTVNGTNSKYPNIGQVTLLGPRPPEQKTKPSGAVHMDPNLVADPAAPHNVIDSDDFNELWHPGHKQRMTQMYSNAGVRQQSETELKQVIDRAAIMSALRQGFAR